MANFGASQEELRQLQKQNEDLRQERDRLRDSAQAGPRGRGATGPGLLARVVASFFSGRCQVLCPTLRHFERFDGSHGIRTPLPTAHTICPLHPLVGTYFPPPSKLRDNIPLPPLSIQDYLEFTRPRRTSLFCDLQGLTHQFTVNGDLYRIEPDASLEFCVNLCRVPLIHFIASYEGCIVDR